MGFTRAKNVIFNLGSGGVNSGNPQFWPEDILLLINEENPPSLVERNIVFQGNELTGLMSSTTTGPASHPEKMVLLRCPPYAKALIEHF